MQVIITNAGKRSKNQVFLTNCGGLILVSCQTPSQPLSLSLLNSMERKEVGKAHGSCWYDQGCRWKPAPPHGLHELQSSPCLTAWGSIPAHPLWELAGLCHASSLALCAVFCPFSNTFPWRCCLSPVHSGCASPHCAPKLGCAHLDTDTWYTQKTPTSGKKYCYSLYF